MTTIGIDVCIDWFRRWQQLNMGDTLSVNRLLVLLYTVQAGGRIDQGELFDLIGTNRSSLVRTVGAMCADGLVSTEVNIEDRRKRTVQLEGKGRAVLSHLYTGIWDRSL